VIPRVSRPIQAGLAGKFSSLAPRAAGHVPGE
jgi:hypothetical protein